MIGKTISHYKILEKLGEGGMGEVYLAEDTKLKRKVALKFLAPHLTRNKEAKERFIHEAQAASSLDHPNICTIYEIDETKDGQTFIVMACYEGETLKTKLERGAITVGEAIDIAIQTAQGLAKVHDKGITHRDIKSANIFTTNDNFVKILDFGLAKLAGLTKLTKEGTTLGTISYMSPEQARGEEIDHRTDIWSLGVMLYEMITGELPFRGEYEQAVIYSILNEEPAPITALRPDMLIELERILDKALEKKKEDRYQNMQDMLIDLQQLKRDTNGVSPKPIGKMESYARSSATKMKKLTIPSKRHKTIIVGFGLLGMIALLVAALLLFPGKESKLVHNRVVVAIFENDTGDKSLDRLGKEVAEWIKQGLQRTAIVKVVPTTATLRFLGEAEGERFATIHDLAEETGAGILVSGLYYLQDDYLWFQAQITNAERRELISYVEPARGSLANLTALYENIGQRIMAAIGHHLNPLFSESAKALSAPPTYDVFHEWIIAIEAFHRGEFQKMIYHSTRAYEMDTTFTAALLWAAIGHLNYGTDAQADSLTKLLDKSRNRLAPIERSKLDWIQAWIIGDQHVAYQAAKKCRDLVPRGKWGCQYGYETLKLNRPREAINILKEIDPTVGELQGFNF